MCHPSCVMPTVPLPTVPSSKKNRLLVDLARPIRLHPSNSVFVALHADPPSCVHKHLESTSAIFTPSASRAAFNVGHVVAGKTSIPVICSTVSRPGFRRLPSASFVLVPSSCAAVTFPSATHDW